MTCGVAQELPASHTTAAPPAPAKPKTAQQGSNAAIATIVANVEMVNVAFSVQDKHGAFVPGLNAAGVRIFEDGREQVIRNFSAEDQVPLTVGLLLDTSPSQMRVLPEEQADSDIFFNQVITPKDLAFVIGFDADVNLLQELTANQAELRDAVDHSHIGGGGISTSANPGPFPTSGSTGGTHLWDAIYLACHQELTLQVGRKAIIVVTDGEDEGSSYTDRDALRAALDSNTIVYAVIAADRGFYNSNGQAYSGAGKLDKLAIETGGRSVAARSNNMPAAFDQIARELRSLYSLAYRSDKPEHDGRFRSIKVEVTGAPDDKIRARDGYYAPPPGQP